MAQTITFTSDQLQQLAAAITATDLRNPQAERLARAGTEISLSFSRAEITHREPPLLQLPQRIVSLRILGREYRDSVQWTEVWRQISSGLSEGRQPVSISQVRTAQGQLLTDTVIVETATTATATLAVTSTQATAAPEITVGVVVTGTPASVVARNTGVGYALDFQLPQGDRGPQGEQGEQGIQGPTGETGPTPTFTVGTVTAAAEPSVTISGTAPDFVLNFELEAGPVGAGSGDVSTESLYADPPWITSLAASKVGLGNVTNESKATMFTDPTFTGTVSGVTATHVGLGNVNNTSDADKPVSTATQTALDLKAPLANPTFTGTVSGVTATHVGLGNVTNESKATMFTDPTFTGTVSGITAGMVGLGNVTNESKATMFTDPTFTGTVSGISQSMISGNTGFTNLVVLASGSLIATAGNWTVPDGVTRFKVTCLGGGGGGSSSFMAVPAVGGGAGAAAVKIFSSVTPGTVCPYTVGAAGTAGAWSNPGSGGNGGSTTFTYSGTTLTAGGGTGGSSWNGSTSTWTGVAGGTATGGDLNIPGGYSQTVYNNNNLAAGGHGADAPLGLGFGGRGGILTSYGPTAGSGYGSGGGGAGNGDQAARTGVAGAPGVIIIEY